MKNKLLTIKDLHKVYYSKNAEIEAIKNITFDLYEGEFISIVGPSGCGKSTFLNILTKMDNLTSGEIIFSNPNLKFGYMLQSDSLLPWKTVFENAILGLEIKKIKNNTNLNYVHKLLNTYGLKDFKDKYPHELSGGMRQRVALIRTLALKPDILILDEPFSRLDYQSALKVSDDVYNIIKKEKKTAIMVTHDLASAISISDRVIVLNNRPSLVKNIYEIKRIENLSPIENRKDKNFAYYYDLIWKDLSNNE
ncbi:MAG: ABC transporter ATP-binding protein [Bacilli bacterium]|jgi:NitT/TauT family transport system ATP-binding protein|nr:ABC transporter ATP-binding protein [Bacilli bacterium]MCX4253827.1 ABC transporter ATP-binding protein [Bacilli bacterium]